MIALYTIAFILLFVTFSGVMCYAIKMAWHNDSEGVAFFSILAYAVIIFILVCLLGRTLS